MNGIRVLKKTSKKNMMRVRGIRTDETVTDWPWRLSVFQSYISIASVL